MGVKEAARDFIVECVREVASSKSSFVSDDVWAVYYRDGGHRFPVEKRVMGGAMNQAVRTGICAKTDKTMLSKARKGLTSIYRSKIYVQPIAERIAEITEEIRQLQTTLAEREAELRLLTEQQPE